MALHGAQIIGFEISSTGSQKFNGLNPATGAQLENSFLQATADEVNKAGEKAAAAFEVYSRLSGKKKAEFLEAIAEEIVNIGDELIQLCTAETGLPAARITSERGRTVGQLRLFADVLREGSWVNARIETAQPSRQPLPKPDIRMMMRPLGPVAVFGASNFPLAFSVAGGDTASALAAGCPVVVKAHPAHPGTSELVGTAIITAAKKTGMPDGVFSLIQGNGIDTGTALVSHPLIKAVGFTGSFQGGTALYKIAQQRPEPIPVYAEMGSTNPVFILPRIMKQNGAQLTQQLSASVTLGTGQFCTNPGLVLVPEEGSSTFLDSLKEAFAATSADAMLTSGIQKAYITKTDELKKKGIANVLTQGKQGSASTSVEPMFFVTSHDNLLQHEELAEEIFGPSSVAVTVPGKKEILNIASKLKGHLTATVHGTEEDLQEYADLLHILEQKAGRVLINGFPTGVEVCHAMVHGGPYPATTDLKTTSVGTYAIYRFVKPVSYQNFPQSLLHDELKDGNPLQILRMVDGVLTK